MKILKVKDYGKVDLNKPKQALDYFIYLIGDDFRLAQLTLFYSLDNYSISKFISEYQHESRYSLKFAFASHFSFEFYSTFIDKRDTFIFNEYFFGNEKSTDIEKKSKLNLVIHNINELLKVLPTSKISYIKGNVDIMDKIAEEFEKKFPNKMVCYEYDSGETIFIESHPYKLLLFCLRIDLQRILDKMSVDYSAFLERKSNSIEILEEDSNSDTNPFPRIFVNYNAYLFFENLKDNICTDKNSELADFSFVFRALYRDKYIYEGVSEREFRDFLDDNYSIYLNKLKTYENCSPSKKVNIYNLVKTQSVPN